MTLPYDYARCMTPCAAHKHECLRHLSPGRERYQAYSEFPGGDDCHGFIPVNERMEK